MFKSLKKYIVWANDTFITNLNIIRKNLEWWSYNKLVLHTLKVHHNGYRSIVRIKILPTTGDDNQGIANKHICIVNETKPNVRVVAGKLTLIPLEAYHGSSQ